MLHIEAIKALDEHENYIWCIKPNQNAKECYFVDFGDIQAAQAAISANNLDLHGILITHHHWDHTDGIAEFVQTYKNSKGQAPLVFGNGEDAQLPLELSVKLTDLSEFEIFNRKVKVLAIAGHTFGHIAYLIEDEQKSHIFVGILCLQQVVVDAQRKTMKLFFHPYNALLVWIKKL